MGASMQIDKAFFKTGPEGNESPEQLLEIKTNEAMQTVLNTFEKAIALLVNEGNDAALQAMQTCTAKLFEQAAKCRHQGCKMEVK